jgi:hypothetical protein
MAVSRGAGRGAAPPPSSLGGLSVKAIVAHHASFIRSLEQPPLIVGHSFGDLFVQMLLDQGFGWAGIAIDPAPIGGIVPGPLTTKAALPVIARVGGWKRPYTLTKRGGADRCARSSLFSSRSWLLSRRKVGLGTCQIRKPAPANPTETARVKVPASIAGEV